MMLNLSLWCSHVLEDSLSIQHSIEETLDNDSLLTQVNEPQAKHEGFCPTEEEHWTQTWLHEQNSALSRSAQETTEHLIEIPATGGWKQNICFLRSYIF